MLGIEYFTAALAVIGKLLLWISINDPTRTEPLTWPEVTSNIDHMANDERDPDAIQMLIADYFSDQPGKAIRVARCESELDPRAYNRYGPYIGIYQIQDGPYDARDNVAQARRMFEVRGWQPWPYCGRL